MSDSPISSEDILEFKSWLVGNYAQISSSSLWMIDFVQTLPMEIGSVWCRKLTGTAMLLLLNRYGFLIYQILSILYTIPGTFSVRSCKSNGTLLDVFGILLTANTGLLFAFRVYAIYNRSKTIIAVSGLLILSRLTFDITQTLSTYELSTQNTIFYRLSQCTYGLNHGFQHLETMSVYPISLYPDGSLISSIDILDLSTPVIGLVFDIFVFTLTVKKTLHHVIEMQRNGQSGVTSVFLRDGSLYFIAAFLIGAATTTVYAVSISGDDYTHVLAPYFIMYALYTDSAQYARAVTYSQCYDITHDSMPNLLINRLMLNLRCYQNQDASGTALDDPSANNHSEIKFAQNRWLGNIGELLDPNQWESQYDEDAEISVDEAEPDDVTAVATA